MTLSAAFLHIYHLIFQSQGSCNENQIYCKSMWCSSTVESIEKGTALPVSVTVTAASLLTGVDMWSECSARGRLALWPCSPQAWPWCTLADVTYWSRLSCSVTACYPPPRIPPASARTYSDLNMQTPPLLPPLLLQLLLFNPPPQSLVSGEIH